MAESQTLARIDRMGEAALLVTLGERIEPATNERVHAFARRLREISLPGVLDIVPAYASVLVTFDPEHTSADTIKAEIERVLLNPHLRESKLAHAVEIPVRYGGDFGPDLQEVAHSKGMSDAEVVALHTAARYQVYFLGFMPGFAYLGGLDPRLAAPRLSTPRVRVPAGSVGIAGEQTAVYPLDSPGGWRLIGRTALPMWDARRTTPALLSPGDSVRFVRADGGQSTPQQATADTSPSDGARPVFQVEGVSGISTIQDLGRPGWGHLGLSAGGAMDPLSAGVANRLVGNEAGAGVLELAYGGPSLAVLSSTTFSLAGADLGCTVDGRAVPPGVSWFARAGSSIRFSGKAAQQGRARCYMAVLGGFGVPLVLGSRSTYLPARFGGLDGRPLRAGDILHAGPSTRSPVEVAGRYAVHEHESSAPTIALRMVPYTGVGAASAATVAWLQRTEFKVSPSSDRMGLRLEPVGLTMPESGDDGELISFGVVRGAIQVPPGGAPVILGADHQTTGGYPVAGVVARAEWGAVAGLVPGRTVRLEVIEAEDALRLYHVRLRALGLAS